jgi:Arm DNA-binding domain
MALSRLKPREMLAASQGDLNDGGGLLLLIGASGSSFVLRYTGPSGKRCEMGLGPVARNSLSQAGRSLSNARQIAHAARDLLRQGIDPLDDREARREAVRTTDTQM